MKTLEGRFALEREYAPILEVRYATEQEWKSFLTSEARGRLALDGDIIDRTRAAFPSDAVFLAALTPHTAQRFRRT